MPMNSSSMARLAKVIFLLSAFVSTSAKAAPATLTFDDEFNSLSLWNGSSGTWGTAAFYALPNGMPHVDELGWYLNSNYGPTSSVQSWTVNNGILSLTAAPSDPAIQPYINNYQYTAPWLETYHSFTQTYGYFEMRAQLPAGQGLHFGFWLLGLSNSPYSELDIVETIGSQPTKLVTTAWAGATVATATSVGHVTTVADTSTGFHTYAVDWGPNTITWYFDGQKVFQTATPSDMHQPMYIIVNDAVGGHWPGPPDGSTQFPASMQIDYIRAYSCKRHCK